MTINPGIFRDYDIRAVIPEELDLEGAERIGRATISLFKPKKVAISYDARLTGKEIYNRLKEAFLNMGVDVIGLGQITTDMMSYSAMELGYDLSIIVTASHNPGIYNGFKMCRSILGPVNGETGFYKIRDMVLSSQKFPDSQIKGNYEERDIYKEWIDFCFSLYKGEKIRPFKVVIDTGNGIAGKLFGHKYLLEKLPIKIIPLFFKPDGNFPNHIPNPLKTENLQFLIHKIKKEKAYFGVAIDGDGDRIVFLTETGKPLSGTIIITLISQILLNKNPGSMILYNSVCGRIIKEKVKEWGGQSKRVRVGYSLIEKEMRKTGAIFAGEYSCHFLYQKTHNCEASLYTLLLILGLLSKSKIPFSKIVAPLDKYFQSGEINFETNDKEKIMKEIEKRYQNKARSIDWLDGVTIWFDNFWANIRPSNTQPLLRLNIEADNQNIGDQKKEEFISLIVSLGAKISKE